MTVKKEINWKDNQRNAFEAPIYNTLISAGAGSGKTAVLSERIKNKVLAEEKRILENKLDIPNQALNKLLVLTFSNASAHDMKKKIKKKILETPEIAHLAKDVDNANICTFDSYALSLVKQYSYKLNIDSNLSIIEERIINIKKREFIDEIMSNLYTNPTEEFKNLAETFFVKSDDTFKEQILKINKKIDLIYEKEAYLNNYINEYYVNEKYMTTSINNFEKYVLELRNDFKFVVENEIYPNIEDVKDLKSSFDEKYVNLFNSSSYDDIVVSLETFRHPTLKKKEVGEELTEQFKKIKENYFDPIKNLVKIYPSLRHVKDSILSTRPYVSVVIDILLKLDKLLTDYKKAHSLFEFTDIAKYAIQILEENSDIANDLRLNLDEILIDEYQDTSDLQEKFVSLIHKNNVYMVGDLKQSIYQFRNANPLIFKNKYDLYSKGKNGTKIDLTDNFRSRKEVIETVNLIFCNIMTDEIGGVDYKKDHKMIHGNETYDKNEGILPHTTEFLTYNYNDDDDEIDRNELEIRIIANDIVNKIKNGYQVYDDDKKQMRNATFKDFAILSSTSECYEKIRTIFKEYNIDTNIHKNENINKSSLIFTLKNILTLAILIYLRKTMDKKYKIKFKHAFASVARSFIFEYSDEEIYNILQGNINIYETSVIEKISKFAYQLPYMSLSGMLNEILYNCDFYNKLTKIEDIQLNLTRVEYFLSLCDKLEALNLNLEDLIEHLETLLNEEKGPEIQAGEKDIDAVVVMTIHKSKGLEFPVVYLPFLKKNFNKQDLNERFNYDQKYGIISPYYNEGISHTIYKELLKREYIKNLISEKNRLFYVALTRAKEKLVFIYENKEKDLKILPTKINSFDQLLSKIDSLLSKYKILVDRNNLNNKIQIETDNSIDKNKVYDYKNLNIVGKSSDSSRASKTVSSPIDNISYVNMQKGLHFHEILEYIDYNDPNDMLKNEDTWVQNKISHFLNSFIFKNRENNKYYREYAFTFEDSKDKTTYNGIIDLLVETPDNIYIVDYKLNNVEDDAYIKQLSIYEKFVATKSNKPITTYLYSIIDGSFKEIKTKEIV